MPGVVQVVTSTALSLVAMALRLTALADHVFPHVVIALLKWDVACIMLFLLTLLGKWVNTGTLLTLLTPVLDRMLTLGLCIDAGDQVGEHVAH